MGGFTTSHIDFTLVNNRIEVVPAPFHHGKPRLPFVLLRIVTVNLAGWINIVL